MKIGKEKKTQGPATRGYDRLLVATDFSPGAQWALWRALKLPLSASAAIHLLHVLPDGLPSRIQQQAEKDARRELELTASAASGRLGARQTVKPRVVTGQAYLEIIRCSRAATAELIVIGKHGQRAARDLLTGSTAMRVIRKSGIPVLVVNRRPVCSYRQALIATDLQDTSFATLQLALRALGTATVKISLVHCVEIPTRLMNAYRRELRRQAEERMSRMLESLEADVSQWKRCIRIGNPKDVLLKEAAAGPADLMALGTHGHSGLSHVLLGSVAERVVQTASCDVLVGRPEPFSFALP